MYIKLIGLSIMTIVLFSGCATRSCNDCSSSCENDYYYYYDVPHSCCY